jgi:predicted component of type VI protein secretion system
VSGTPPATNLQLEVVAGNAVGTTIGVDERIVFGRQTEGSGQLANDPELSRHHAEITHGPSDEYQLEDLSSTNGTYVNGTRLTEPIVLSLGDEIELGTTKLVVRTLPAPPAPEAPAVDVRAATAVTDVPAAVRKSASAPPALTPPPPTPTPPVPTPRSAPPTPPSQPPPAPAPPPPAPAPPPPPPLPPPPPPPLDLRLKVDLERAEAEVALGEGPSVRMRLQEGRWQIVDGDPQ